MLIDIISGTEKPKIWDADPDYARMLAKYNPKVYRIGTLKKEATPADSEDKPQEPEEAPVAPAAVPQEAPPAPKKRGRRPAKKQAD